MLINTCSSSVDTGSESDVNLASVKKRKRERGPTLSAINNDHVSVPQSKEAANINTDPANDKGIAGAAIDADPLAVEGKKVQNS